MCSPMSLRHQSTAGQRRSSASVSALIPTGSGEESHVSRGCNKAANRCFEHGAFMGVRSPAQKGGLPVHSTCLPGR